MENNAKEFGLFIDRIRLDKQLSREELIEDIMSLSQYKRYLRGISSIPNSKLVQIADKLSLSISDLHFLFRDFNNDEYKRILHLNKLISMNEFKEAFEESQKFDIDMFVLNSNKQFYEYCVLRIQHSLKLVSDVHVLDLYSDLIDYPNCTKNETYSFVEISVLLQISLTSAKMQNYDPVNHLYNILSSDKFHFFTSVESTVMPSIYSAVASVFGLMDEYDKIIEITELGIKYCAERETSNALSHLYYFNGMANYDIGNKDIAFQNLEKTFMILHLEDNPSKFKMFKDSFETNFDMKLSDLLSFYTDTK